MMKILARVLVVTMLLTMAAVVPSSAAVDVDKVMYASVDVDGTLKVHVASDNIDIDEYTFYVITDESLTFAEGENQTKNSLKLIEQKASKKASGEVYGYADLSQKLKGIEAGTALKVIVSGKTGADADEVATVYPKAVTTEIDDFKNAQGTARETELEDGNSEKIWSVDLDNAVYKANKTAVLDKLAKIIDEQPDSKDMVKLFNTACILAELQSCDADEFYSVLLKNQAYLGLKDCTADMRASRPESISTAFDNLKKDTKENPLDTVEDLNDLLYGAEAIGTLNDAGRGDINNILSKYNERFFGLDLDGDYKKVDKAEVARLMEVVDDEIYTSKAAVKETFDKIVEDLPKNSGNSNNAGGGGGGGAGGGGGNTSDEPAGGVTAESGADASIVDKFTPVDNNFKDLNQAAWAEPYITYLKDKGVMTGDGNGYVRPNDSIKREEFVKLLLSALKPAVPEGEATIEFADAKADEWYMSYITDAVKTGIVKGVSENTFGIGSFITRQDAAVMVYRTVNAKKAILNEVNKKQDFADADKIADYAKPAIGQLQMSAVLSGYEDGSFLPGNNISRAEAAKIIYTVLKNINEL